MASRASRAMLRPGAVAEWLMAAVLKTAGRKPREFESHPLRQARRPARRAPRGSKAAVGCGSPPWTSSRGACRPRPLGDGGVGRVRGGAIRHVRTAQPPEHRACVTIGPPGGPRSGSVLLNCRCGESFGSRFWFSDVQRLGFRVGCDLRIGSAITFSVDTGASTSSAALSRLVMSCDSGVGSS